MYDDHISPMGFFKAFFSEWEKLHQGDKQLAGIFTDRFDRLLLVRMRRMRRMTKRRRKIRRRLTHISQMF